MTYGLLRRSIHPQTLFHFQPSLGDQRQLPFLHALRMGSDLRRIDATDERNTFPQQPHVLPNCNLRAVKYYQ
ncbi:hypothetical protein AMJ99_CH03144 [Rhizobium esperanzae]|nr:hypothetical protein AMJ99_CH03144 [Rhizobium esperanzae]ANM35511.1 hypothetical protein AMK04_CH03148 [Rhizobium sp. N871]